MNICSKCGSAMVDANLYDPEGTVPLLMETDQDGRMWACIPCSNSTGKGRLIMKTLDEFNADRRKYYFDFQKAASEPRKNGIACPHCGKELLDSAPSVTLTSDPPQKNIHCENCDYRGFRIA